MVSDVPPFCPCLMSFLGAPLIHGVTVPVLNLCSTSQSLKPETEIDRILSMFGVQRV